MTTRRRSAKFDAVLVYMDEPQVVTLMSQKSRVVAVAIDASQLGSSPFLATTVVPKDWERYLEGKVDLRYLFTVPISRLQYHFDLDTITDGTLKMTVWSGEVKEDYLPSPRFFSSNHTEPYEYDSKRAEDEERLIIDGEWELTDFGQFQQKFSDVYTFLISQRNWSDDEVPDRSKRRIREAFLDRPFQGGFSYVHLFKDLAENVSRVDQVNLSAIQYASPGSVEIFGRDDIFGELRNALENFNQNRREISQIYRDFHKYLSRSRYLKLPGSQFKKGDAAAKFIARRSRALCRAMKGPDYHLVSQLTDHNTLVAAKVVLAFYRRLADAALYFAQGRVSYDNE